MAHICEVFIMTNSTISNVAATEVSGTEAAAPAITFTVKADDTVRGTIAKIKNHPAKGLLVAIEGNPMAFLPNGCIAGRNEAEKAARRAELLAAPGTEVTVSVMGEPTIEHTNGKAQGRIKVSEQRAVIAADKAARSAKANERSAAIQAAVDALVPGSIVEGKVTSVASKPSDRNDGSTYAYGVFVAVAPNVSGLLHVKQIEGGHRSLESIVKAGTVTVEILEARIENGVPRVQLSQTSVAAAAASQAFFDQYPEGAKVKGTIVRVGEVAGNLHGRIIELASGDKVFLADDDTFVKSESALARGNSTRVVITAEVVGGLVRVTRKGV
jgi:ribosomal protein S1